MDGDPPPPGDFAANMALLFAKLSNPATITLLMGPQFHGSPSTVTVSDHRPLIASTPPLIDAVSSHPNSNGSIMQTRLNPNSQDLQDTRLIAQDSDRVPIPTILHNAPNAAASPLGDAAPHTGNLAPPSSYFCSDQQGQSTRHASLMQETRVSKVNGQNTKTLNLSTSNM